MTFPIGDALEVARGLFRLLLTFIPHDELAAVLTEEGARRAEALADIASREKFGP